MERLSGVIVCGAGPVGLLTALGLAREGVQVTLIDAESGINDSPRAAVYYPTMQKVLERYGLLEDALAIGHRSTDFQFRVPQKGTVIKIDTSLLDGMVSPPTNLHLGQHLLAEIVLRHLSRLPNADIRWNTRMVGLTQDARGVTVEVQDGDGAKTLWAEWLVGADGARSTVRKLLELPFEGFTWPDRFVATNVRFDFDKYGYAAINQVSDPVNWAVIVRLGRDNLWRCTFGEDPDLPEDQVLRRIPQRYAAILPAAGPYEVVAASPYRVHERCASTFRVNRVLLAGDAAHVCNPCGGMGLNTGILDAVVAADALNAVISGAARETLLDFYAEDRRRVFLEVSTPMASNFKRLLSESDPARREKDEDSYRVASENAEVGQQALMASGLVVGRPLPLEQHAR